MVCFPRTRGDGPASARRWRKQHEFPPHARGWTGTTGVVVKIDSVSPARAGMDRGPGSHWKGRLRFPRTRGDGPSSSSRAAWTAAFPPHARGWTPAPARAVLAVEVSPARAGMDRMRSPESSSSWCFPRTRGDGPRAYRQGMENLEFPPHARGWTGTGAALVGGCHVSPARAGMDRHRSCSRGWLPCFPRTRGDGPRGRRAIRSSEEFPPHARGWTIVLFSSHGFRIVSPARAGMDPTNTPPRNTRSGFPRTRGDGPGSIIGSSVP